MPLLLATTLDAIVRIRRSAWAWMPVNRGRGLFRLTWLIPAVVLVFVVLTAAALAIGATS